MLIFNPVHTESIKEPSVFPLALCCNDNKTTVTLGCLVTDFIPGPVTIDWDTGSLNSSTVSFPTTFRETSKSNIAVGLVTVSGAWDKQKFTCSVKHELSNSSINKIITGCSTVPTVKIYHAACDYRGYSEPTFHLLCLITNFPPGEVKVTWLVNGEKNQDLHSITAPHKQDGKLVSTYSKLSITKDQWIPEKKYTCQVTIHGKSYEFTTQKCLEPESRGVSVYLSPPSPSDLYIENSPQLTCLVVDLASEKGVSVNWSWGKKSVNDNNFSVRRQLNATVTITSTLPVDAKDWIQGETYHCVVSHPHLPREIEQSISKPQGKRLTPDLYVFSPPKDKQGDRFTLTCLVQNFFPSDITVQWLSNNNLIQPDWIHTTGPYPTSNSRKTFFTVSVLEVKKSEWEKNRYTCRVVHEALSNGKTKDVTVSKDSEVDLQDLCVEETESKELEELWTSTCIFITLFLLSVSYSAMITVFKVQWVFSAMLQRKLQNSHDYNNIM